MAESKPATSTMDVKKIDADTHAVKVICLGDSAVGKSKLVKKRYSTDILSTRDEMFIKRSNSIQPFLIIYTFIE